MINVDPQRASRARQVLWELWYKSRDASLGKDDNADDEGAQANGDKDMVQSSK